MRTRTKILLLAASLAIVASLAACTNDKDSDNSGKSGALPRLEKAKSNLDEAETITVALSTAQLPAGVTGLLSATGEGNHSPAFDGEVKVIVGGASIGAEVVSLGGVVYAKTGFAPTFVEIDPASLSAPDPAQFMAASGGISDLLVKAEKLTEGDKSRDGGDVLTSITGRLSGKVVKSLIPSADPTKSFAVTYRLTADDVVRDVTIKGPFYGTETVEYLLKVSTSDQPVTIKAP